MHPSQNLLPNVQRHNDGIVTLLPKEEATSVEARSGGPSHDPDDQHIAATKLDRDIDVAVKATHSAPVAQLSIWIRRRSRRLHRRRPHNPLS